MKKLLFICTGNYYRSRFAEGLFNHLCAEQPINWHAFSRGLAIHWVVENRELSPFTEEAFRLMGIHSRHSAKQRISLTESDLKNSDRVIALKSDEHLPMMREQFPAWADKIEYWGVHDIDFATSAIALPQIEQRVRDLYRELTSQP